MSLGDSYNNNKQNNYSPTVYSPYKMSNSESKVDASTFAPTFWNSMLKLAIAPLKPSNDDTIAYDYDKEIAIYLNHTKARLFAYELRKFKENPDTYNNQGVNSNNGVINICNGKEFGVTSPVIVIRKLDNESGQTVASAAYEIKTQYHYAIRNFVENDFKFDRAYYDDLEVDQLISLLETYYEAMTSSVAYSVIDNNKYEMNRLTGRINAVAEKLGVEFGKKGNYNNKSSNSIFNKKENSGGSGYTSSSIEDIEEMM